MSISAAETQRYATFVRADEDALMQERDLPDNFGPYTVWFALAAGCVSLLFKLFVGTTRLSRFAIATLSQH